jgi:WD40 repeat protein
VEVKTLRGHNGAVFGLAFRPDGKILASASADRTVKLWDVATGQRRDTFSQPTKEQVAIAWSSDGKRVASAGFDNRIRVWEVSPDAKETTNPLLIARYAHEQPITRLVWSGEKLATASQDGTIKLWEAAAIKERALIQKEPNWPSALALAADVLVAGRIDGSLGYYTVADGKPVAAAPVAPPKPSKVARLVPRGIQRGGTREVRVLGENLAGLKFIAASDAAVQIVFADGANAKEARLWITTPESFRRGAIDLGFAGADGKSAGTLKLHVDDLRSVVADGKRTVPLEFPVSIWGTLERAGGQRSV